MVLQSPVYSLIKGLSVHAAGKANRGVPGDAHLEGRGTSSVECLKGLLKGIYKGSRKGGLWDLVRCYCTDF